MWQKVLFRLPPQTNFDQNQHTPFFGVEYRQYTQNTAHKPFFGVGENYVLLVGKNKNEKSYNFFRFYSF